MNKNPAQAEAGPSSSLPVSIRRRQAQQAIVRRAAQEAREETRRKREARHLDREKSADDTSSSMILILKFTAFFQSNHNFSQAGPSECQHDNIDDDGLPDPSLPRHSPTPPPDGDFFLQRSPSPGPPPPDEDFVLRRSPSPGPPPAQALPEHQRVAIDVDKLATLAILPKMKDTIEFIRALQNASLDDPCSKLNAAALHRLREPHQASGSR
ncbi:uncharacterized protein F5891DRAFT_1273081 [Suillus fuscotomentosus]|uniref:Uncharacterized protein n=1 Tax=Suillus fuscotomentosus TaxID=1912939 RepID=A0AAD4ELV4_9AGAM|nr:uncharacterized protein F5891DRAFT_1273081 [Suillus fuscotomentosus]KAG1908477.1 hypothetical protein F5891DRAFT_1273081 [Suillus fuscotomentosus]